MENQQNNNQALIDLGKALSKPFDVNNVPHIVVPNGFEVKSFDRVEPELKRIDEQRILTTSESFVEYVNNYDSGATVLFINDRTHRFKAIFDYHKKEQPDRCDFIAIYDCPMSDEWETWSKADRTKMSQHDFGAFLEDNIDDIVEPSGAEILTCALALESVKKVDFASAIKLSNGEVQLKYEENIQGTQKQGSVNIPEEFYIGIPVFKKGEAYKVKARLRYRINDANLTLWFELSKPEKVIDDAFDGVKESITKAIPVPYYV